MDLKSLIAKMTAIEEGAQMAPPSGPEIPVEECGDEMMPAAVEECGMDMPGDMMSHAPKQQDNVTMNVSMNGSGAGGIRDLMDILRNLEDAGGSDEIEMPGDELIIGATGDVGEIELPFADEAIDDGGFGDATTEPAPEEGTVDLVTNPPSNDLNKSKTMFKHNYRGGDNAMAMESLISKLSEHYNDIKNEAYNPNSVAANHARDLEKSRVDDLKKKAEAGDEKAKAALKRHEDKKAAMRADFDARMER